MNKHILVTGGAGYIGSACVKVLLDIGHKVTVVDNLITGDKKYVDARAEFVEGDITDKRVLQSIFDSHSIDAVIHFAALNAVEESEQDPLKYFNNNVGGTMCLLSAMEEYGVPEIVFSSSASVYAPTKSGICTEESALGAINIYGNCKIIEERLIQELARTGKLKKFAILRYFNVAGDAGLNYHNIKQSNVFPTIANKCTGGHSFNIFGTDYDTKDGTCVRDYIHLSDLVDAHIEALEHAESGMWNLGTSHGTSVQELIAEFEKVSGKVIKVEKKPRRAGDQATVLANPSSAAATLGWEAKRSLREMVESTLNVYAK